MPFATQYPIGYSINYGPDEIQLSGRLHKFCGKNDWKSAYCPNCSKPFLKLLELDLSDSTIRIPNCSVKTLPLLFCWTCNVSQSNTLDGLSFWFSAELLSWAESSTDSKPWTMGGQTIASSAIWKYAAPFYYQISEDRSIKLLQYARGGVKPDFPYRSYPVAFPEAACELVPLTQMAQEVIRSFNECNRPNPVPRDYYSFCRPRHQVGGEPLLVQQDPDYRVYCPSCKRIMPFVATIANDCLDKRGIVGFEGVQILFHFCAHCAVVAAFQQCD